MKNNWVTPEAFCWFYAAGCVDAKEHEVSKGHIEHLKDCLATGKKPSDDVIRRVFRRPFEALGEQCILEDMQKYWRETHRDAKENTPVYRACVMHEVHEQTWPAGTWWRVWYVNPITSMPEEGHMVRNVHGYKIREGMVVYIHGIIIAEVTDESCSL